jgi:hypothetical protein
MRPLVALLSRGFVAFTIEADNLFERSACEADLGADRSGGD